jgi:hypothetical protein
VASPASRGADSFHPLPLGQGRLVAHVVDAASTAGISDCIRSLIRSLIGFARVL